MNFFFQNRHSEGLIVLVALLVNGCAVGPSIDLAPASSSGNQAQAGIPGYVVTVTDERRYVLTGEKPAHFIGKYRTTYGILVSVYTESHIPLAELIHSSLNRQLERQKSNWDSVRLHVSIRDWNTDGFASWGRLWYQFDIRMTDADGSDLSSEVVKGSIKFDASKTGFERDARSFRWAHLTTSRRNFCHV